MKVKVKQTKPTVEITAPLETIQALTKLLGNTSVNDRIKQFHLSTKEDDKVNSLWMKLADNPDI